MSPQVIEQELNGVEGFLYMSSTSQSNGTASITVTFAAGTDVDLAQMDVQNRLRRVEQRLPEEVRRQGIQVNEANAGFLLIIALDLEERRRCRRSTSAISPAPRVRRRSAARPRRRRRPSFSSEYAMRIWLDPDKLASLQPCRASEALARGAANRTARRPAGSSATSRSRAGSELNATIADARPLHHP